MGSPKKVKGGSPKEKVLTIAQKASKILRETYRNFDEDCTDVHKHPTRNITLRSVLMEDLESVEKGSSCLIMGPKYHAENRKVFAHSQGGSSASAAAVSEQNDGEVRPAFVKACFMNHNDLKL